MDLKNLTPFSVPVGGNRGIKASTEMTPEEWAKLSRRSKAYYHNLWVDTTGAVLDKFKKKWFDLPSKTRSKFILHHQDVFSQVFCHAFVNDAQGLIDGLLERNLVDEVVDACKHALGDDISVELMGSLTRGTADLACDLDLQVRRTGDRANESFTEEDKDRVMRNLEALKSFVFDLQKGSIAIKFKMPAQNEGLGLVHVDLVLFRERPEQFPCLRGGEDFYENSARINSIIEKYPAVAAAVRGVKTFFKGGGRPKGLLLEAIAWRLSKTFALTPRAADTTGPVKFDKPLVEASHKFFKHLVGGLRNWKASSFGNCLQQDLSQLSQEKRAEYEEGFENMKKVTPAMLDFSMLRRSLLEEAFRDWTPGKVSFEEYVEKLVERRIWRPKALVESKRAPRDKQLYRQYTKGFGPGASSQTRASGNRTNRKRKRR